MAPPAAPASRVPARIPLYQVDAFPVPGKCFSGNPAAVCPLDAWLPTDTLQSIAAQLNLSETVFVVPRAAFTDAEARAFDETVHDAGGAPDADPSSGTAWDYAIRWFSPTVEIDLCGHATLAASHVIFTQLGFAGGAGVVLQSRWRGVLNVRRVGDELQLDFPLQDPEVDTDAARCAAVAAALNGPVPIVCVRHVDVIAVLQSPREVAALRPDLAAVAGLDCRGLIATAAVDDDDIAGDCALAGVDFVYRFFAPQIGIDEDPVTGSACTQLAPYWARVLDEPSLRARQLSHRGGVLMLDVAERAQRVYIAGTARLVIKGEMYLGDPPPPSAPAHRDPLPLPTPAPAMVRRGQSDFVGRVLIKLGGSMITDKATLRTPRPEAMRAVAHVIKQIVAQGYYVVLIHGAGSYGHIEARKWKLSGGIDHSTNAGDVYRGEQRAAARQVRADVRELGGLVAAALREAGVETVHHPAAAWAVAAPGARVGAAARGGWEAAAAEARGLGFVSQELAGLLPQSAGDAVFVSGGDVIDAPQGDRREFAVLSGDVIVQEVARMTPITHCFFLLGDAEGLLSHPPGDAAAELLRTWSRGDGFVGSHAAATDVTGGIYLKAAAAAGVADEGVPAVWLLDGRRPERMLEVLEQGAARGTRVVGDHDEAGSEGSDSA